MSASEEQLNVVYVDGPLKGLGYPIDNPTLPLFVPVDAEGKMLDPKSAEAFEKKVERVRYRFYPVRIFDQFIIVGSITKKELPPSKAIFDLVVSEYAKKAVVERE